MAASRPQTSSSPKKPENFFEITKKLKFEVTGNVWSVCKLPENKLAILIRESHGSYIEIFDLKTKNSISKKIRTPEHATRIHLLPNGKIFCDSQWRHHLFDPETKQFTKHTSEDGHFIGMLNENEFVLSGHDGFKVVNLDEKIPPIKITFPHHDYDDYRFQILKNETIAVHKGSLELYHQCKDGKFSCVEDIDFGLHHEVIQVGKKMIVKYFPDWSDKADSTAPLLKVWTKEHGTWKPVPGLEYKPDRYLDWTMNLQAIPDSETFMLVGFDKITFLDSRTLNHFDVETDFGERERYYDDYDDGFDDEENQEEPDFDHSSISVLDNGQIALGYEGSVVLLTVQRRDMQLFHTFLMGTHKEVGKDSAINRFSQNEIFDPKLHQLIFSFINNDVEEFKTEHAALSMPKEDEKSEIAEIEKNAAWDKYLPSQTCTEEQKFNAIIPSSKDSHCSIFSKKRPKNVSDKDSQPFKKQRI